jgi:arabinogalactan oligomer/maltooligosaccharide transport system permease protein
MILALATLVTIYPVLWVFSIAFSGKQSLAIADLPANPRFVDRLRAVLPWPEHLSASNFVSVMTDQPFARWIVNSALVAVFTTVLGVFLACTAAYAFSRFKFPGRRAGMMGFLISQMFPGTLMLIPLYIIIVQVLGLGSSRIGLVIVYATTSIPFSVWMLKGYFDTIPKELEEAAVIEGASVGKIFWRIVLPLAKPAVAITALFCFMTSWNEFILAATFMDKEDMYTAPVGLRFFVGGFSQQWGYFAAGSIIVSIPVVLLFLYLQKYLVSGLTAGGVKG